MGECRRPRRFPPGQSDRVRGGVRTHRDRLLYDDDALYVAARLYQPPAELTANMLRQNGSIVNDDTLFVTIDPFNTRRAGYFFGINPNSVRFDGLYRNVSEYYSDWDTIFYAETGRFDGGWIAEYAIPFKSISFDPNTDTWGLNFSRTIQKRDEDIAWTSRNRRWDRERGAGQMTGLHDLDQGVGLDIVPSASVTNARVRSSSEPDASDSDFEPSLDVFYRLTPSLNAASDREHGFLGHGGRRSPGEPHAVRPVLSGEARLLPSRSGHLRVRPDRGVRRYRRAEQRRAAERAAVLLAPHRPRRGRRARRSRVRRQDQRPRRPLRGRRVVDPAGRKSAPRSDVQSAGQPVGVNATTLSVVRAKAGIGSESTIGTMLHERRSTLERRQLARRRRLPVPELPAAGRPNRRSRRVVSANRNRRELAATTALRA